MKMIFIFLQFLLSGFVLSETRDQVGKSVEFPVYVSYNPVGFKGHEKFTVYVNRPNSNYYVGYFIQHDVSMDDLVYVDYYRIWGAEEYRFEQGRMKSTGMSSMVSGESECVWHRQKGMYKKVDFTGGYHGDELLTDIKFEMDGIELKDLKSAFDLKPCRSFTYKVKSTMHETADHIDGKPVPVKGHPVDCIHVKTTVFQEGGYKTTNKLIWQREVPVAIWYAGISCIGKMQATEGYNNLNDTANFVGTKKNFLERKQATTVNYFNPKTQFGAKVSARIISPENGQRESKLFVWDREKDSKYYLSYDIPVTTVKGEEWVSIMTVEHYSAILKP